jgi:DNA modification methylase
VKEILKKRLNDLDGSKWLLYSKSVWNDIRSSPSEKTEHPAQFPSALVRRLLEIFTHENDLVLDPFLGSGTTLLACRALKRYGIGVELNPDYIELTKSRLAYQTLDITTDQKAICADSRHLSKLPELRAFMEKNNKGHIDFMVTSPPYWDVLHESHKKTVLPREKHPLQYSELEQDLGNIHDYQRFLDSLKEVFNEVYVLLHPSKYCAIVTMDIRKGSKVYPLHSDLIEVMTDIGFRYQDVIIWDRDREYNYLRPMGYPTTFIVNRIHEYILIFRKPK